MKINLSKLSPALQERIKAEAFKIDRRSERTQPEETKLSTQYPIRVEEVKALLTRLENKLEARYFDDSLSVSYFTLRSLEAVKAKIEEAIKAVK